MALWPAGPTAGALCRARPDRRRYYYYYCPSRLFCLTGRIEQKQQVVACAQLPQAAIIDYWPFACRVAGISGRPQAARPPQRRTNLRNALLRALARPETIVAAAARFVRLSAAARPSPGAARLAPSQRTGECFGARAALIGDVVDLPSSLRRI